MGKFLLVVNIFLGGEIGGGGNFLGSDATGGALTTGKGGGGGGGPGGGGGFHFCFATGFLSMESVESDKHSSTST